MTYILITNERMTEVRSGLRAILGESARGEVVAEETDRQERSRSPPRPSPMSPSSITSSPCSMASMHTRDPRLPAANRGADCHHARE